VSPPAVARNSEGRLAVFACAADGVYHTVETTTGWSEWTRLGTFACTSYPVVAENANGRLEIFVRRSDFSIWHASENGDGSWSSFATLGGITTSDPAVARDAAGQLVLFGRDVGSGLWRTWQETPGGAWHPWEYMQGEFTSNPASQPVVVRNGKDELEVFVRGPDDALYHRTQRSDTSWSDWTSLGGTLTSDPIVVLDIQGRLRVIARGPDEGLFTIEQQEVGACWSAWSPLGGSFATF